MAKRKTIKEGVLFIETPYGDDIELFTTEWNATKYGMRFPDCDVEKLYWTVEAWSTGKGETRIDWLGVARTFHLKNPASYEKKTNAPTIGTFNKVAETLLKIVGK